VFSVIGAALFIFITNAKADVSIEWAGPADCGDAAEIESEIARLLPDDSDASIRAVVSVVHTDVWRAGVRLEDDETVLGERTFEAGSCEELRGAVALLIVLAIDPDAVLAVPDPPDHENEADEPTNEDEVQDTSALIDESPQNTAEESVEDAADLGQPENTDPSEAASVEASPELNRSEPAPQAGTLSDVREVIERPHWGIAARAGVDFGALPVPSPVFSLGAFNQRRRFGLGVYAFIALPQNASTSVEASGRLALGAIRATPGLHLRYGRLMLDLRSVVELGVMGGRGRDVAGPQTGYSLWAALGAEAGFSLRIGPVSLGFRGDIRVPLNRPLYAFRGPLDVHRAASLVGRAEFVLGLHFL
jgi:hypothetical protein